MFRVCFGDINGWWPFVVTVYCHIVGGNLIVGSDVYVVTHVSVMLGHGFREFGEGYAPFRGV